MISFFVEGVPVPQPRHSIRVVKLKNGKSRGHAYIPGKHPIHAWRTLVELAAKRAMAGRPVWEKAALESEVWIFLPRPKNHYGTGRNSSKLKPSAPKFPIARGSGDSDNYDKGLLDAMEGIVFDNDCTVCDPLPRKRYAKEGWAPGVEISIRELREDEA